MATSQTLALIDKGTALLSLAQSQRGAEALGRVVGRLLALLLFPLVVMLLFGGIYYLMVRPRRTFAQALFRWWNVLLGLAAFILGVLGLLAGSLR